jgi:hypothetical protein
VFLKAARARGYESEDQWLDELRYAEFVTFQLSASSRDKLSDGTFIESESGILKDAIAHSITLCHQLEAGCASKPVVGILAKAAIGRIEQAGGAYLVDALKKLERDGIGDSPRAAAELLCGFVIHQFTVVARECMAVCASDEFGPLLRTSIARFVKVEVAQQRWLSDSMRQELNVGITFFVMGANPWAGMPETEDASRWHVGEITGEALSQAALKLLAEAAAPAEEEGSFSPADRTGVTEPNGGESTARARKRGPKPDHEGALQVAAIVAVIAPDGAWRSQVDAVCEALDKAGVPYPKRWRTRDRFCDGWAAYDEKANAVKAIEYRLEIAKQRNKVTSETLS